MGAFGHDGKVIYFVDTDGYFDGRIVDADTIEYVCRHSTPKSSVVAVGVFSRRKWLAARRGGGVVGDTGTASR